MSLISGKTKLVGLIGTPISHSLSPAMHNEAFTRLGLDYVYLAFDVGTQQLKDVITGLRALNVRGFNVTMPNKTIVHQYLDHLTPAAELAGAVNTVVNNNGVLTGHNTDGAGYMQSLQEAGIQVIGKKITIAGSGGAGKTIAIQAALDGVKEISIFNQRDEFFSRAERTVKEIAEKTHCRIQLFDMEDQSRLRDELATSTIFTNTTPVGMKPMEGMSFIPDSSYFHEDLVVSDIIYIPEKTKLLQLAEERGCQTLNGLSMMLWQGAKAFELWTGKEMPVEHVKKLLF